MSSVLFPWASLLSFLLVVQDLFPDKTGNLFFPSHLPGVVSAHTTGSCFFFSFLCHAFTSAKYLLKMFGALQFVLQLIFFPLFLFAWLYETEPKETVWITRFCLMLQKDWEPPKNSISSSASIPELNKNFTLTASKLNPWLNLLVASLCLFSLLTNPFSASGAQTPSWFTCRRHFSP